MSGIVVELNRTGFPVTIGRVELWFDTSQERLLRFYDMEDEIRRRLVAFELDVITSNLDNEIEKDGVTKETVQGAIDLEKKQLEIQYDLLFGDGTFEKLYETCPDYQALENVLVQVCEMIGTKLDEIAKEREKIAKAKAKSYLKKSKTLKQGG